MLKNPLQETAEDHRMAVREGQLSRKHSPKSKSRSLHPSPVPACGDYWWRHGPSRTLACALSLDKRGVKSTIFDTGNHGLGGRMGTRMIGPQPLIFDHAAQFFTVTDSRFMSWLMVGWREVWCDHGKVRLESLKWVANSIHFLLHLQNTLVLMGCALLRTLYWPRPLWLA